MRCIVMLSAGNVSVFRQEVVQSLHFLAARNAKSIHGQRLDEFLARFTVFELQQDVLQLRMPGMRSRQQHEHQPRDFPRFRQDAQPLLHVVRELGNQVGSRDAGLDFALQHRMNGVAWRFDELNAIVALRLHAGLAKELPAELGKDEHRIQHRHALAGQVSECCVRTAAVDDDERLDIAFCQGHRSVAGFDLDESAQAGSDDDRVVFLAQAALQESDEIRRCRQHDGALQFLFQMGAQGLVGRGKGGGRQVGHDAQFERPGLGSRCSLSQTGVQEDQQYALDTHRWRLRKSAALKLRIIRAVVPA